MTSRPFFFARTRSNYRILEESAELLVLFFEEEGKMVQNRRIPLFAQGGTGPRPANRAALRPPPLGCSAVCKHARAKFPELRQRAKRSSHLMLVPGRDFRASEVRKWLMFQTPVKLKNDGGIITILLVIRCTRHGNIMCQADLQTRRGVSLTSCMI